MTAPAGAAALRSTIDPRSAAFTEAVTPPPSEVITGASLASVTVTVMVWTSVRVPDPSSVAVTSTT